MTERSFFVKKGVMAKKVALITGVTGQDGAYLADFLINKGYIVHGLVRRSSTPNTKRIDHLSNIYLHYGDLSDGTNLERILSKVKPDEVYNLAAQSHVKVSFDTPVYTGDIVALGTVRLLDAIKDSGLRVKFYQASSSEMFGRVTETPQTEGTYFHPRSPYAVAKVYAFWMTINYRESYGLFACNGILFNHESPLRGETFVTRKITKGLVRIKLGQDKKLFLGNIEAKRDWGFSKDYVEAMWLMLQQEKADDYVIATGESHSVREFIEEVAKLLSFKLIWQGKGLVEKGIDAVTGKIIIEIDSKLFRPTEVDTLIGDASKARKRLKWKPKVNFKELVKIMVDADLKEESKIYHL